MYIYEKQPGRCVQMQFYATLVHFFKIFSRTSGKTRGETTPDSVFPRVFSILAVLRDLETGFYVNYFSACKDELLDFVCNQLQPLCCFTM